LDPEFETMVLTKFLFIGWCRSGGGGGEETGTPPEGSRCGKLRRDWVNSGMFRLVEIRRFGHQPELDVWSDGEPRSPWNHSARKVPRAKKLRNAAWQTQQAGLSEHWLYPQGLMGVIMMIHESSGHTISRKYQVEWEFQRVCLKI
jgi:hypothetical protein